MLIQLCKSARNRISLTCMSTQVFFQSISKFIMRSEKYNSELLILNFASTGVLKIPFSIFVMLCTTLPAFFLQKTKKYSWHGVFTRLEKMCMFSDFFCVISVRSWTNFRIWDPNLFRRARYFRVETKFRPKTTLEFSLTSRLSALPTKCLDNSAFQAHSINSE